MWDTAGASVRAESGSFFFFFSFFLFGERSSSGVAKQIHRQAGFSSRLTNEKIDRESGYQKQRQCVCLSARRIKLVFNGMTVLGGKKVVIEVTVEMEMEMEMRMMEGEKESSSCSGRFSLGWAGLLGGAFGRPAYLIES